MVESLLLSPLLDDDFGDNGHNVVTLVHRYLKIMGAPKTSTKLFTTRGRMVTNAYIYFVKAYVDDRGIDTENAIRLNTKDAPVEQYLKKTLGMEAQVFQYPNQEVTIIRVENHTNFNEANVSQMMRLLAIYPRLVPWLCPVVSQSDKQVIEALASADWDTLCSVTNKICEEKLGDFRTEKMMGYLKELQSRTHESELRSLENDIENINDTILDLSNQLKVSCENLKAAERRMALLQKEEVGTGDDLIKFFKAHKQLQIVSNLGDKVIVHVSEKIEYYDFAELKKQLEKPGTFWYSLNPNTKKLIKYVFIERKAKLRTTAAFAIDARMNVSVSTINGGTTLRESMPHPHLDRYHCLGTNAQYLNDFNLHGDWDLAIEQIIAAAKNINIYDRTVMSYMVSYFESNSNATIFELPDGTIVCARQIYGLINKEEGRNEE